MDTHDPIIRLAIHTLSGGLPYSIKADAQSADGSHTITIRVRQPGGVPLFEAVRTVNPRSGFIRCEGTFVSSRLRRLGIGRRLMLNTYHLAEELGLNSVRMHATLQGRYIWPRMGFLPTPEAWRRVKPAVLRLVNSGNFGDMILCAKAQEIMSEDSPGAIASLAYLNDLVSFGNSPEDNGRASYGYALLTSSPSWHGEMKIGDEASYGLLKG